MALPVKLWEIGHQGGAQGGRLPLQITGYPDWAWRKAEENLLILKSWWSAVSGFVQLVSSLGCWFFNSFGLFVEVTRWPSQLWDPNKAPRRKGRAFSLFPPPISHSLPSPHLSPSLLFGLSVLLLLSPYFVWEKNPFPKLPKYLPDYFSLTRTNLYAHLQTNH